MSLVEKIKQEAKKWEGLGESELAVNEFMGAVLKILEDREQKLRELADLLKTRPQKIRLDKSHFYYQAVPVERWFKNYEKKFAELGLPTKKETEQ